MKTRFYSVLPALLLAIVPTRSSADSWFPAPAPSSPDASTSASTATPPSPPGSAAGLVIILLPPAPSSAAPAAPPPPAPAPTDPSPAPSPGNPTLLDAVLGGVASRPSPPLIDLFLQPSLARAVATPSTARTPATDVRLIEPRTRTDYRFQRIAVGGVGLAATYALTLFVAGQDHFADQSGWVAVPVAGPWITLARRGGERCGPTAGDMCGLGDIFPVTGLVLSGIAQAATAGLLIAGLATPPPVDEPRGVGVGVRWVSPWTTSTSTGLALGGAF